MVLTVKASPLALHIGKVKKVLARPECRRAHAVA